MLERRPIKGWEPLYEITRDGQVYSVRAGRFIPLAHQVHGPAYIAVEIEGLRHERCVSAAVAEAWGDLSALSETHRRWLQHDAVRIGDLVIGTFDPPRRWGQRLHPEYIGSSRKRGLFEAIRKATGRDNLYGHVGEIVIRPLDPKFTFAFAPLCYLIDVEPVLPADSASDLRLLSKSSGRTGLGLHSR
jgi:hypothetical protein